MRSLAPLSSLALSRLALSCAVLAGCGPAEPATAPPAPSSSGAVAVVVTAVPSVTAEITPTPAAEPTGTAVVAPPATPSAAAPYADLAVTPGDARLEPAAAFLKAVENARARAELAKVVAQVDASGTLEARLAAHVMLGRACQLLGDTKCAAAHHGTVRELWKDPKAARDELDALGGDDTTRFRRLGRALNAVGEALFFAAEEKRLLADQEKFPVYKGSGKKEEVLRHVNTKVAAWVKARRARIEQADKAYVAILGLEPVPPPRWVISAGSRVGGMWAKFTTEFQAAPMPAEWKQTGLVPGGGGMTWEDIRREYHAALAAALASTVQTARAAYRQCSAMSIKYAYKDALSQECDDWLARNPDPAAAP